MTAVGVLEWVTNAVFVLAALGALRLFLRHRSAATGWLLATFAGFAMIILSSLVSGLAERPLLGLLVVAVLLVTPYLLFRFADAVVGGPALVRHVALGLAVLVVVSTVLVWPLPEGGTDEFSGGLAVWLGAILLFWAVTNVAAGWMLVRASIGEPGVVRNRLRLLAVATIGLGLYLPLQVAIGTDRAEPADEAATAAADEGAEDQEQQPAPLGQAIAATLGLLFLVGFAPPSLLRAAWREGDERRLYEAAVGLMGAHHPDDVAGVVVPGARALTGAPRVVMRSADGRTMAATGRPSAELRRVREVRTHPVGDATLELTVAPTMPVFGSDEAQHLDRLALLAELALDRVRLLEAERAARDDVERLNAELESFVYTTSHDLKNPLIALLGYLDVIAEDHGPAMDADMRHMVERMQVNARHMDSLIRDLLELSRVGRVDVTPERVDLEGLVDDLGRDLASRHPDARVVRGGLPALWMNPTRARQLFANLVDNAAAYGGRADVTIRVHAEADDLGGARLVVRDDGRGIDEEHLERVFGVFERLDPDHTTGTGMGLAICRRVVEHLGGSMQAVASTEGAVFHIDLPATALHAEAPAPAHTLEGSAP